MLTQPLSKYGQSTLDESNGDIKEESANSPACAAMVRCTLASFCEPYRM